MPDKIVAQLHAWLAEREGELLDNYRKMLQIPSVETEAEPNAPFGQANRVALDLALQLSKETGMQTRDLDGYCGYGEFGSGDKQIGIFGHLDVVPVGPGWKHDPFGAVIEDGYVYARGAVDDKGPTMAAFYAARAVQAVCPDLPARVRVVFGCDEESGFECIKRYVSEEPPPTLGFAPDAGWPLIHAEKGIANLIVTVPLPGADMKILSLQGGQRPNIVIDDATAKVLVSAAAKAYVESKVNESWDKNLNLTWDGDTLTVHAIGKAAHGSWPNGGDSAAIRVLRFLMEASPLTDRELYEELFEMTHIGGAGLGIDGRDKDSGSLTCNLGIVETEGDHLKFTFNVRYPVTWNQNILRDATNAKLEEYKIGARLADMTDSKPLYFPLEHPLTKTICEVYASETGDTESKPGVMGGGTYARAVENTVAIGTGWMGDGEAHQTNERCAIESLYKMSRIYAHLIYQLAYL